MKITTRTVGKCKVLDCSGKLTLGPATADLREAIREAVQDGTSKIVLNLRDVPHTDMHGISELVSGFVYLKNQGGCLTLLNLALKIHKVLVITKLTEVFDIYDDEQKALDGCE